LRDGPAADGFVPVFGVLLSRSKRASVWSVAGTTVGECARGGKFSESPVPSWPARTLCLVAYGVPDSLRIGRWRSAVGDRRDMRCPDGPRSPLLAVQRPSSLNAISLTVDRRSSTHFGRSTFRIADVRERLTLTRLRRWRRFLHRVKLHLEVGMLLSTAVTLD